MKHKLFLFTFLLSFLSIVSFAQNTETRQVSSFKKLHVGGSYDVVLEKSNSESVRLEARNLDLNKVITEVKNGSLHIYLEKGNYRNFDLTVYVSYSELEEIHKSGSGNLSGNSELAASNLKLHFSGSGNSKIKSVNADELTVHLSGSGNISLAAGTAKKLSIHQSGSGNIKSSGVQSEDCAIHKSGSGNAEVNVNRTLEVSSSGSGNVKYKGSPSINKVRFSGSGELVKG